MKKSVFFVMPFLLVGSFTGTAGAAEAREARASQIVEHRITADEARAAAEYWTPERMASAKNADRQVDADPNAPRRVERAQADQKLAEPYSALGDVGASIYRTRVVGKVFYKDSAGGSWVCSGSVVNSPARNMVSTAGHCVHEGDGGNWHNNWLFVPDYHHNSRPFGTFEAYNLTTLRGWTDDGSWAYDSAFALMGTNGSGQRLVDATGVANGVRVGGPFNRTHTVIGYPCDQESCEAQYNCVGPSEQATVFFPRQITMRCGLSGGSSGGPWLTDFQDSAAGTGLGYVHGVTSNNDIFGNLRSPYFEDAAEGNLYRTFMNG